MRTLGVFVALVLCLSSPAVAQPLLKEDLLVPVPFAIGPGGWRVGTHTELPGMLVMTEFLPAAESMDNWNELFTIANYSVTTAWGGATPQQALARLQQMREKTCPGSTSWNLIASAADSVLYEWQARPCLGWPSQHELARILFTTLNRFQVRYTYLAYEMPPALRQKWLKALSAVSVERRLVSE